MLIIFSGFSGSGKTFTAKKLQNILKCPYLSSDIIRKSIANVSLTQRVLDNYGEGLYSSSFTKKTYKELLKRAKQLSLNNKAVIIDATFLSEEQQKMLLSLNEDFIFIFCYAPDNIIKDRLDKRIKNRKEVSDGRWEIYLKQKENFKNFLIPENKVLKINTGEKDYFEKILDYVKINLKI